MKFLFLDVEATGIDPEDRLIQVAYKYENTTENQLFKPPVPIKLPAMAVHHVTEKMVLDKEPFLESKTYFDLIRKKEDGYVLVAHNAAYDLGMLKKEGVEFPVFIDTLKIARYIDEGQFENHQMQYLRYFYGIEVEATAHDALGDIIVLEQVFLNLQRDFAAKIGSNSVEETNQKMIEISSLPSLIRKINFGKYRDSLVADIADKDRGYLEWLWKEKLKAPEGEEDWLYTLEYHLK